MVLGRKTIGKGLLAGAKVVAGVAVCAAAVTIGTAVGVAKAVVRDGKAPQAADIQGCEPETSESRAGMTCEGEKKRLSCVRVTAEGKSETKGREEEGQAEEAGSFQTFLHVLSSESGDDSSSSSPRSVLGKTKQEAESTEPMTLLSRGANGKVYAQGREAVKVIACVSEASVGAAGAGIRLYEVSGSQVC